MTVRIPGAVFLEIRFDPRSSTADMNDTVQLFCVLDDECLPMHEVMWGHQHGGMGKGFPRSLILPGDAVRIEFTASSMELVGLRKQAISPFNRLRASISSVTCFPCPLQCFPPLFSLHWAAHIR